MKVLLHGATNGSNFGDYLFAELFYQALEAKGIDTFFYDAPRYGISSYFRDKLQYTKKWSFKSLKTTDALVYISGGYFCEIMGPHSLVAELKDIRRYLLPALWFMKKNKPIYVLGVGAGPFTNEWFSKLAIKVLNYAKVVTVRNNESAEYCKSAGITNHIEVTADTALLVKDYIDQHKKEVEDGIIEEKKILLLHIDSNREVTQLILEKIKPAVKTFLDNHSDYCLYLAADGIKRRELYDEYKEFFADFSPKVLEYDDPWVLCKQIARADTILTTKLHVGIVACAMGTSVLSFPNVPNKTVRFYKQIGEGKRCLPLRDTCIDEVIANINRFAGIPIAIPKDLREKAQKNLDLLPD